MKKEITIDGVKYRKVEEEIILEVGKWYIGTASPSLYLDNGRGVSVNGKEGVMRQDAPWQHANMQEVEKLLIKEAKKRGYKEGVRFNSPFLACKVNPIIATSDVYFKSGYIQDDEANVIFDFKTGKWAEIIEEKKPLYTNEYGTQWFKGDYPYEVVKDDLLIQKIDRPVEMMIDLDVTLQEDEECSEIMTERECHRWIDENWDKLNK